MKKVLLSIAGFIIGVGIGYIIFLSPVISSRSNALFTQTYNKLYLPKKYIIGFLPYWLLSRAKTDYSQEITTLTYFGLRVEGNGSIQEVLSPQEAEPGWNTLYSGNVKPFFQNAKQHNVSLSLLIFNGNPDAIAQLVYNPIPHGHMLAKNVLPVLKRYGFSDLNLDIEYTQSASPAGRLHFTQFVQTVKHDIGKHVTLTVEVSTSDVIKKNLIDIKAMGKIADHVVLMAYDFHSPDSFVTGPVAPLNGAGTVSEYDVKTALQNILHDVSGKKIVLGIPDYGYEWETFTPFPRSAVIPNSGVAASTLRAASCASCSAKRDTTADEVHSVYRDKTAGDYHQFFYPDIHSTRGKLALADALRLEGVGIWALGYEDKTILTPLAAYKQEGTIVIR
ncbi:MAG TPA: glycosyl hydrolase family 18 protein [Patescibacteria group bacterium]|nr:glycosyl hydrolase family 18 protein [Patescibacteria group bacterium]